MKSSPPWKSLAVIAVLVGLWSDSGFGAANTLPLSGQWRFQLDRADDGINERWFTRDLPQTITLPGILQAQSFGDEISTNTPWVLSLYDKLWFQREDYRAFTTPGHVKVPFLCQPQRHYLGAAWYQRDIEIPKEWEGRRVALFLERTRWETRAWLDGKLTGTNRSLCTPHEFDFGIVAPGKHRLTVRVDNRMLMNYRPDAHAVSDSLGSTWNGIVGKIELRSTPLVWLKAVQAFSQPDQERVIFRFDVASELVTPVVCSLTVGRSANQTPDKSMPGFSFVVNVPVGGTSVLFTNSCLEPIKVWDEFSPTLISHLVHLSDPLTPSDLNRKLEFGRGGDQLTLVFGLRDFKTSGQEFVINGRPTHLRGTHYGGDFPLTGYPPCDVEYWRKLFKTCKEWGLNHVRFHSFCPPDAAFTAADQLGIYLQIEPGTWNEISPGTPMEQMLYEETERIIKYYGNHPSFVLLSASNEAKGRWKEACSQWVRHFRDRDPRRLYTPDTGWSLIDEPGPVGEKADYLAVHRIGQNMMRGERGWFGRDYARAMQGVEVPNIAHELGQWVAYPDFDVIKKFAGFIRPGNYEIFRESATAKGLLEFNQEFARASGRFQLACYKEEIEANLRTPGLGGFQLLDLHDYTGQGTALVGVLDPFWEAKGYVKPEEWRQFCSPVVPLVRLTQRIFTTADSFTFPVEVANYSPAPVTNALVTWDVRDTAGKIVAQSALPPRDLPLGRGTQFGNITAELSKLPAPAQYRLRVTVGPQPLKSVGALPPHFENTWNFWLYPVKVPTEPSKDVLVTSSWNEAEARLAAGGKVLFLPRNADLDWSSPPLDNVPVFWNRLMNPQWGRMLGLWSDTDHPALAGFPTEANCDWQWTQITKGTRAVNLGQLPRELKPIVAAIDDWNRNWKLAPIFEVQVGRGKLLVCSFDLTTKLDERVVARQLRRSLLDYAASEKFQPRVAVSAGQMRSLWFDTLVMRKLGAVATFSSGEARDVIDGDPNTFWNAGGRGRGADAARHPHTLTIAFTNAVPMSGILLMNRQNDRDHAGDIRDFRIELGDDDQTWRTVAQGELPSTWNPQTVKFVRTETARRLRLTARSGFGADSSAALAELAVLYAGPPLPENAEAVEYRRVRSTSTDVDEGPTAVPTAKPRR